MIIKVSAAITTTPYSLIGVQDLRDIQNEVYIFDTRKLEEIVGINVAQARYLRNEDFDEKCLSEVPEDAEFCYIDY